MKVPLQALLLRLLDDWTVRPVGGGRVRQADVLLVAATNVDLRDASAVGRFRADLFYRLNTVEIVLPALRNRADFGSIVRYLLESLAPGWRIDDAALAALRALPWPGNIRELRSVLTRLTLSEAVGVVGVEAVAGLGVRSVTGDECGFDMAPGRGSLRVMLHERIRAVHRETAGNVSETARRLGVSRNTVYRALPIGVADVA